MAGEQGETRLQARAQEESQAEAQSACCTGAGFLGGKGGILPGRYTGEAAEASFREWKVVGAEPFLGAINSGTALEAQERILDIDGNGGGGEEAAAAWRNEALEAMEFRPGGDLPAVPVEEEPAQGVGHAESAIIGRAASDADETTARPRSAGGEKEFAEPAGVELEGVELFRWQECQPDGAGGLDHGSLGAGVGPPLRIVGTVGGVNDAGGFDFCPQLLTQDGTETIAAIAHRDGLHGVAWTTGAPAGGDGDTGGLGGEGALEFIGYDQDSQGHVGWWVFSDARSDFGE